MLRPFLATLVLMLAISSTASAGHHYYFPTPIYAAPPTYYVAPVVAWQPAYVVPTATVVVHSGPFPMVSYAPQYYAPMVPMAAGVAFVPARPAIAVPAYRGFGRRILPRGYRGVEIEIERDGDIEIDYR